MILGGKKSPHLMLIDLLTPEDFQDKLGGQFINVSQLPATQKGGKHDNNGESSNFFIAQLFAPAKKWHSFGRQDLVMGFHV